MQLKLLFFGEGNKIKVKEKEKRGRLGFVVNIRLENNSF